MSYYAMGDLHFSGTPKKKPMDIFSPTWHDHDIQIITHWKEEITENDTVFLVGDFSWAMRLQEAEEDFKQILTLPGKKVMIRGNHDYWWTSKKKMSEFTKHQITFLQGDAILFDDCVVGGTRGYLCPGDTLFKKESDMPIYERELLRTRAALDHMVFLRSKAQKEHLPLILLLHYPPCNEKASPSGFTNLLEEYEVDHCVFGHLHHFPEGFTMPSTWNTTQLHLVSSNYIQFHCKKIL